MEETQPATQAAPEFFPSLSKPAEAPATDNINSNGSSPADWFVMEGLKGQGERPSYFSPKYKTLVDQAKAYTELEKKLGSSKAPDKYDISKYENVLNPEDMNTQKLLHVAREKHLTQDAVEGVLDVFKDFVTTNVIDPAAERAKLGPDGAKKVEIVSQWAANTFSEKTIEAINKLPKNAELVTLLDEMRQLSHHNSVAIPSAPSAKFIPLTVGEVEAEMKTNFAKYNSDPRYRAEIKAKFAQAMGED